MVFLLLAWPAVNPVLPGRALSSSDGAEYGVAADSPPSRSPARSPHSLGSPLSVRPLGG